VSGAEAGLLAFFAALAAQRTSELALSSRGAKRLRERGAREHGSGHFPLLVGLHVLFPLALAAEFVWLHARPWGSWPAWLALLLGAQALRIWSMHALGERWTVRILVVPGEPLVRGGPYRFLRHPAYVAVAAELLAAPLLFGAWRTALGIGVLNAVALAIRIRAEASALRDAGASPVDPSAGRPRIPMSQAPPVE
jgi:methyltransferase